MPFNAALIVMVIGLFIALATWVKTKRIGAVAAVIVAMFLLMAITDPGLISEGGRVAARFIRWGFGLFTG